MWRDFSVRSGPPVRLAILTTPVPAGHVMYTGNEIGASSLTRRSWSRSSFASISGRALIGVGQTNRSPFTEYAMLRQSTRGYNPPSAAMALAMAQLLEHSGFACSAISRVITNLREGATLTRGFIMGLLCL